MAYFAYNGWRVLEGVTAMAGLLVAANLALLEPIPAELVERIQGQVSELDWNVFRLKLQPSEEANPWESLRARTSSVKIDLAVWVETSTSQTDRLSIFEPQSGKLKVKSLTRGPTRQRSANYETLALILRSHIKAYSLRQKSPTAELPPVVPIPSAPSVPRLVDPSNRIFEWRWSSQYLLRGFEDYGVGALRGSMVWGNSDWAWGASLGTVLPGRNSDAFSELKLSTVEVSTGPEWFFFNGPRHWMSLSGQIGAQRYSTEFVDPQNLVPNAQIEPVWSLKSSLAWSATYFLFESSAGLGLRFGFELDAVAGAPAYFYQAGEARENRNKLWFLHPKLILGMVFRGKRS